jgi:Asp-tRNA(Asn)/Glu-tRNA(Gln) amidotransferase B subunit
MATPRKKTAEQEAIRWAAGNTDFVRSLAEEISQRIIPGLNDRFTNSANDPAMDLYIWYRKLGMIPSQCIRKFEEAYGLADETIRTLMTTRHLEDCVETVSINDVVRVERLREYETVIEAMKSDLQKEKDRNGKLQESLIEMSKGKK